MVKSKNFKNVLLASCVALVGLVGFTSCDKDDDDNMNNDTYSVSGNASGDQEVPAVTTSSTGTISGTYNKETNTLDYTINWANLSGDAVMAHIHGPAAMGVNADVLFPLTIVTNGMNGMAKASIQVADSVETALLNGQLYYNIHTASHPDGEIRGQIVTQNN